MGIHTRIDSPGICDRTSAHRQVRRTHPRARARNSTSPNARLTLRLTTFFFSYRAFRPRRAISRPTARIARICSQDVGGDGQHDHLRRADFGGTQPAARQTSIPRTGPNGRTALRRHARRCIGTAYDVGLGVAHGVPGRQTPARARSATGAVRCDRLADSHNKHRTGTGRRMGRVRTVVGRC